MSLVRKKTLVLQLLFPTLVLGSTVLAAEPPRDPIPPGGGRLRNHWATCVIGLNSGHVGGIWDNISGRRLVQESYETYRLTTRDGQTITVSEKDDVVHSAISTAPPPNRPRWGNAMVYFARNPKIPGSEIRKSYYFALVGEEQRIVCRSISITAPTDKPTLFTSVSNTILAPSFRKDSLYHYVVPQGVAGDQRPLIRSSQITKPLIRRDHSSDQQGRAASEVFQPRWKVGLAQYLYRVGRHWVYPVGLRNPTHWTANGWQIASGGFILADKSENKRNNRLEMRYHIFGEDRLAIHEEYLGLPELAKLRDDTREKLRLEQIRTPGTPARFLRPGDRVPSASLINIGSGGNGQFRYGVFATSDDSRLEQISPTNSKTIVLSLTGKQLKERFAQQRKKNPASMGGMYIYRRHESSVLVKHPDWIASRTPNGLVNLRPLKEVFEFETRGIVAESDYLGTGVFYWDAALDAGQVDWDRRTVSQTQSAIDRWKMLFEALHQRDKLLWTNSRTGSAYYDITYYEASGAQKVPGKSWRDAADMDLMNKIYQVPGTIHVPLYWWSNGPDENTQVYQNHCLALALSPRDGAWTREVDGKLPVSADDGVLFEVIDEFRDARFVRIGLEPAWWNNLETQIEAYTLQMGRTWFLNVISHRKTPSTVTASIDLARTKLDSRQPIFCWQHQARKALTAGSQYPAKQADRYFTSTRLAVVEPSETRLKLSLADVPPEILRMCTINQVPAWIVEADGVTVQLRLSGTLGSTVTGRVDVPNTRVVLETTGNRDTKLAAWWNTNWGPARVQIDGLDVPHRVEKISGQHLLVFDVPKGPHQVQVTP